MTCKYGKNYKQSLVPIILKRALSPGKPETSETIFRIVSGKIISQCPVSETAGVEFNPAIFG